MKANHFFRNWFSVPCHFGNGGLLSRILNVVLVKLDAVSEKERRRALWEWPAEGGHNYLICQDAMSLSPGNVPSRSYIPPRHMVLVIPIYPMLIFSPLSIYIYIYYVCVYMCIYEYTASQQILPEWLSDNRTITYICCSAYMLGRLLYRQICPCIILGQSFLYY